jgi:SAM-dependent methyltransferase
MTPSIANPSMDDGSMSAQSVVDARNTAFWEELCGTGLAQALGITSNDPEALDRFDAGYFAMYPYLKQYVDRFPMSGERVLEVGIGYGTLSRYIAERGADYYGLDIAEGPVEMVRHRLVMLGKPPGQVVQGSILAAPFDDGFFDMVYSIGCLHHTGNLSRAVSEVRRLLRPGGSAVVMLYNKHSFRQLVHAPLVRLQAHRAHRDEVVRRMYDANQDGQAAPHTEYVSRSEVRRLFRSFKSVEVASQNFDNLIVQGRLVVRRERLLSNAGRVLGLDLYIVARA